MNTVELNKKTQDLKDDNNDILNAKMEEHYKKRLEKELNNDAKDFNHWVDIILESSKGNKDFFRALYIVFGIKGIDEKMIGEEVSSDIVMDKDFEVIGKFAMMNKLADKKISSVIEYLFQKANNVKLTEEENKINEEIKDIEKKRKKKNDDEISEHL